MVPLKNSFSTRLSLYVIIITMVLFTLGMFLVWHSSCDIITKEAKSNAANMLDATIGDIEMILSNVEAATQNSVWVVKEHKDSPEYMYNITEALVKDNPNIVGSTIAFVPYYFKTIGKFYSPYTHIDADSVIHSFQLGTEEYNYPESDWFKTPVETMSPHWSEPYFDEGGGQVMMTTYSVPITDEKGKVFAVITADVSLTNLTEIVDATRPYDNSYAALVSSGGVFIAHTDTSYILKRTLKSVADEFANGFTDVYDGIMNHQTGIGERYIDGNRVFVVYGPVFNGWGAFIACRYVDVLADVETMRLVVQLIIVLGLILIFLCCVLTVRKLTKPIKEFSNYALEIASGHFEATLPQVTSKDEIKDLHDSLGFMQKSLKQLEETTAAKQRFESELNIARNIQLGLLPRDYPQNLHAMLVPAKEVGGDLYDFAVTSEHMYFSIGDVSGKGVPAALFMAITRSALRFSSGLHLPMGEVMKRVNMAVNENNDTDMFVTLFVGKLNLKTGHLQYCNAGHNPIVIVQPDGKAEYLHSKPNLAAGLVPDFEYQGEEMDLAPGTRLILYTDGVTEAERNDYAQYGEQRLLDFAVSHSDAEPQEFTERLYADVREFADGAVQNDDITIMTIDYGKTI